MWKKRALWEKEQDEQKDRAEGGGSIWNTCVDLLAENGVECDQKTGHFEGWVV